MVRKLHRNHSVELFLVYCRPVFLSFSLLSSWMCRCSLTSPSSYGSRFLPWALFRHWSIEGRKHGESKKKTHVPFMSSSILKRSQSHLWKCCFLENGWSCCNRRRNNTRNTAEINLFDFQGAFWILLSGSYRRISTCQMPGLKGAVPVKYSDTTEQFVCVWVKAPCH